MRILRHSLRGTTTFFTLAGMQDKKKRPSSRGRRAELHCASKWRVASFGAALRRRRNGWRFRLRPAQSPDGVGANAPEHGDLRGLGLLGLAILALVLRANELSVNEDMVALVESVRAGFAEAIESDDAVPLGFGLPLVQSVYLTELSQDFAEVLGGLIGEEVRSFMKAAEVGAIIESGRIIAAVGMADADRGSDKWSVASIVRNYYGGSSGD